MSGNQPNGKMEDQPDDTEPSPERQAELEAAYEANVAASNPPYKGVEIRTRGELLWVMHQRDWTGNFDVPISAKRPNFADLSARGNLSGVELVSANLADADFNSVDLSHAVLFGAKLVGAELADADLTQAVLINANLTGADLTQANLAGAKLWATNLTDASLAQTNLSGTDFMYANLSGAYLAEARFDVTTGLAETRLNVETKLADVVWDNAPLTRIDWERIPRLGDEAVAHKREDRYGKLKRSPTRIREYQTATRTYRQLAVALRNQGLSEDADRYAYRAQLMQRIVLRRQAFLRRKDRHVSLGYRLRKLTAYLGSGLLDLIAGYGYRPGRSLLAYILIILTFAGLYLLNGQFAAPHLHWDEALVLSVSSFHGRGFFTTDIHLGDTLARLAAGEAIVGLLIEITFIATFTQRFFSR